MNDKSSDSYKINECNYGWSSVKIDYDDNGGPDNVCGPPTLIVNDIDIGMTEGIILLLESACARARFKMFMDKPFR